MKKLILFMLLIPSLATASIPWKKITTVNHITVSARPAKNGILPFKATGTINSNIETLTNILMDYKNKNKWAPKLEKVKLHKQISHNQFIFSEYYKTPWPASDREFLLKGSVERLSKNKVIFKAESINEKSLKSSSHVQADVKYINVILQKVSKDKTSIQFEFHGDMNGWMPVWLMNLIQKKWPLRFIEGLEKYSLNESSENITQL